MLTPSRSPLADQPELRDRMLAFIAQRDHVSIDRAKQIFAALTVADLTMLELQMPRPQFTSEYDPLSYDPKD